MKCYDFELNISTYIAGELKQSLHSSFKEHRDNCSNCNEKFTDISYLLKNMSNINPVITSDNFIDNLSKKIQSVDNQGPSIWEWLINLRPFGFQPAPALGFLLGFNLYIGIAFLITWLIIALLSKYSSLSSLIATLVAPIFLIFVNINYHLSFFLFYLFLIIAIKHLENIKRLLNKTENKIKFSK